MISGIFFLTHRGDIITYRAYRELPLRSIFDAFRVQVIGARHAVSLPIVNIGSYTFFLVRKSQIFISAVSEQNCNAASTFEFLHQLGSIIHQYVNSSGEQDEVLSVENCEANIVLIQELLDEMMDWGYPQDTNIETLKLFITQKGLKTVPVAEQKKVTIKATGAVSYRSEGLKYRSNEVFVDIVERVNLLMSRQGTVLQSYVDGIVQLKAYLSGMPEIKFAFNDELLIDGQTKGIQNDPGKKTSKTVMCDDVSFHQCVKLTKFEVDRTISFTPPDGEFDLMKYRITENINLPFVVIPIVTELGKNKLEIKISLRSRYQISLKIILFSNDRFASNVTANNLMMKIPVPPNTASVNTDISVGKAKYERKYLPLYSLPKAQFKRIAWRIRNFSGGVNQSLRATIEQLAQVNMDRGSTEKEGEWSRPPINLDFQVPMLTASGLAVRFLRVYEKSNYRTVKWGSKILVARSAVLRAVKLLAPNMLGFVTSLYSEPSDLLVENSVGDVVSVPSVTGVRQGDPLGPALFCLALSGPLSVLRKEFRNLETPLYLDDGYLAHANPIVLSSAFDFLEKNLAQIGLFLNRDKCLTFGDHLRSCRDDLVHVDTRVSPVVVLGVPVGGSVEAAIQILDEKAVKVFEFVQKAKSLPFREFYQLVRNCALPQVSGIFRNVDCRRLGYLNDSNEVCRNYFKPQLRSSLSYPVTLLNLHSKVVFEVGHRLGLSQDQILSRFALFSLPIKSGGLGLRPDIDFCEETYILNFWRCSGILGL